jgi:hypothetical protein
LNHAAEWATSLEQCGLEKVVRLRDTPCAQAIGRCPCLFSVKMQPFGRLTHLISRAYYFRLAFIIKDAPETGRPKTFTQ